METVSNCPHVIHADLAKHCFKHIIGKEEAALAPAVSLPPASWETVLRVTLHLGNHGMSCGGGALSPNN